MEHLINFTNTNAVVHNTQKLDEDLETLSWNSEEFFDGIPKGDFIIDASVCPNVINFDANVPISTMTTAENNIQKISKQEIDLAIMDFNHAIQLTCESNQDPMSDLPQLLPCTPLPLPLDLSGCIDIKHLPKL